MLQKQIMQKKKSYLRTELLLQGKAVKTCFTRNKPINKRMNIYTFQRDTQCSSNVPAGTSFEEVLSQTMYQRNVSAHTIVCTYSI